MDVKELLRRLDLVERAIGDGDKRNMNLDYVRRVVEELRLDIEIDCRREGVELVTC